MTAVIGSWVRWGKLSPTRLGYAASDIGRVIAVKEGKSGGCELDVQFPDGDVIRGAFAEWFETAQFKAADTDTDLPELQQDKAA